MKSPETAASTNTVLTNDTFITTAAITYSKMYSPTLDKCHVFRRQHFLLSKHTLAGSWFSDALVLETAGQRHNLCPKLVVKGQLLQVNCFWATVYEKLAEM